MPTRRIEFYPHHDDTQYPGVPITWDTTEPMADDMVIGFVTSELIGMAWGAQADADERQCTYRDVTRGTIRFGIKGQYLRVVKEPR